MQNNTVRQKLISLNSGKSNIAYAGNNMWFTENPNYADLVAELKESIQNNEVRGSILIATDSGIIWASGSRSVDKSGDEVTPLSTYEIGSLTKMYTAAVVFKLIDEGKLSLTDRVTAYLPAYTKANDVTIFDLLHMRSGIVDFANDCETFFHNDEALIDALDNGEITDDVFLELLYSLDLIFEPGSKMAYCNTNYVLLAMIIEKITGKSYRENVRERIFEPLGMDCSSATTFGDVTSVPEGKGGYLMEYQIARGAGDIHSNVLDLLKFNRAFFNARIVSAAGKAGMLDFIDAYGCGWEASQRYADLVLHDGETNSYYCLNYTFHASDPEKRCYFLMLTCCNEDDDDEENEEETAAAENETAEESEEEEEFNQYQLIFDLCKKYLQ